MEKKEAVRSGAPEERDSERGREKAREVEEEMEGEVELQRGKRQDEDDDTRAEVVMAICGYGELHSTRTTAIRGWTPTPTRKRIASTDKPPNPNLRYGSLNLHVRSRGITHVRVEGL